MGFATKNMALLTELPPRIWPIKSLRNRWTDGANCWLADGRWMMIVLMVMKNWNATRRLSGPAKVSYAFIALMLVLAGALHLTTPLLVALFAFFVLARMHFFGPKLKWLAVLLFVIALGAAAYGLGFFINHTIKALPEIADKAIPTVIRTAKEYHVELPFTDYDSLKEVAFEKVSQVRMVGNVAKVAKGAGSQFVFVIVGCIVAIGLFLDSRLDLRRDEERGSPDNLYTACSEQIRERFTRFYESFATVMGAQIVISAINTVFTAIFVMATHLPYALLVVGMTFLCGLVPVIGNLLSNTIIVGIGFTVSPRMALFALIFLVVIHKLEYFLNSKIVGDRIRNPLWLTLLALVIGERLMGVPGMILAPVVLHYVKVEATMIRIPPPKTSETEPSVESAEIRS